MTVYLVKVSFRTGGSRVHAQDCRVVRGRGARDGVHPVDGPNAVAVAHAWDARQETAGRGLAPTRVCGCARLMEVRADRDRLRAVLGPLGAAIADALAEQSPAPAESPAPSPPPDNQLPLFSDRDAAAQ